MAIIHDTRGSRECDNSVNSLVVHFIANLTTNELNPVVPHDEPHRVLSGRHKDIVLGKSPGHCFNQCIVRFLQPLESKEKCQRDNTAGNESSENDEKPGNFTSCIAARDLTGQKGKL